jgi:uncharacterized protein YndB with AHSA1/START domain
VVQIRVSHDYDAPIERVWACYTDHRGWSRWARIGRVTLAREGQPTPDGVGCIRAITTLGVTIQEEVLAFEPPRRMTYTLIRGAVPIRNHQGEVRFEPLPGGRTHVTWRCQFDSMIPFLGGVLRHGVARTFAQVLARMTTQLS